MGHVVLVRHGRVASASAVEAASDPGLGDEGLQQAEALAGALALYGPLPLYTSPMLRCRETAAPLAARWGVDPAVEAGVSEVRSPAGVGDRRAWLDAFLHQTWSEQTDELRSWRDRVVDTVTRIAAAGDGVIVSHFVAINAVVGAATRDDRVVSFSPPYCSRTEVRVDADGALQVVELGS